ncbi:PH domain-containing protein [Microbacterium algeriense]|uniref:PH domain-containing protein n=1 Tax=Microbacterium algeriense TaxID=2615184 RepID=UPI0022E42306|nr:PH domain-containing protein [Microbacterium algeriense]
MPNSPEDGRTFRSSSGTVVMVVSLALAVFLLGDAVVRGGWGQTLLLAPWVLLGLWIIYEISYVSMVRIGDDGALVQNMLRRTEFGWHRVRDIDLQWQLSFSFDDGTELTCWGGPAHARPRRSKMRDEEVTVSASLQSLTDIRDRWQAAAGHAASAPIRRSWDTKALLALAGIVAWAVVAVLIVAAG